MTNIGLLYPKVRNNIGGDIPTDVPTNQNIGGDVSHAGIPGGVDASVMVYFLSSILQSCDVYWWLH